MDSLPVVNECILVDAKEIEQIVKLAPYFKHFTKNKIEIPSVSSHD